MHGISNRFCQDKSRVLLSSTFLSCGGIQSILVKSTSVHEAGRGVSTSGVRIRNREMLEEEHQHLGGNPEEKNSKNYKRLEIVTSEDRLR